jgi:hypothetical protein
MIILDRHRVKICHWKIDWSSPMISRLKNLKSFWMIC